MVENNPHKISTMGTGNSLAAITDGSDFPHSGLIKGLSQMARQNIVVKNNSNDFDITQSTANGGTVTVSAGTYLRDGKKYVAQYKTGTTAAVFTFNASELITTYDKGYHLVVVDKNNFILIRKPTVLNKVPDYTSGDTIIAVFEYASTSSSGAMNIQYLTTDKTENSVSIAYAAGTGDDLVYTEASAITGTSAGLFISGIGATGAAADDKVIIQDTSASDVIKSVTAQAIANLAPIGTVTSVTAGTGMTQSGTSTVNPTLNVIGGAGITASSNEILITDAGVTMAKLANIATDTFIGRTAANTGVPKALSKAEALAILNVADGANNYTHPDHSGDVTSNSDGATTIVADAVTYAKMQNLGTANRVLGSTSTGLIGEVQIVVDMMAANSVDSAQYVDGSIDHEHLSGDCIDGDNIQDSVINSEHYANGSIDNEHLATGIDSVKIANGSVSNTEFQYLNGVTSAVQTQLDSKIKQGLHSIWVPAEAMTPRINAGCGALAATAAGNTNQPDFRSLPFDTSTQEYCQFSIAMPKMWNEQAIDVKFYWTSTSSSTSQNCVWEIRATAISDNETLVTNFGNATGAAQANSGAKILSI